MSSNQREIAQIQHKKIIKQTNYQTFDLQFYIEVGSKSIENVCKNIFTVLHQ